MKSTKEIPVFFHEKQLEHHPSYEWVGGEKVLHPETMHRAENIFRALSSDPVFSIQEPDPVPLKFLREAHAEQLIQLYRRTKELPPDQTFYPSVFPKRHQTKANPLDIRQSGYFCYDSGTPLTSTTWDVALLSASCAFEALRNVESGKSGFAYALCRPPGHHASRDLFGGYCYFNNAAIIAKKMRASGRVAIVDIDFHHGNGTQDIFYRDNRVLFISIHGDPKDFYPFFSGFSAEQGAGDGLGFNWNLPLPRGCDGQGYLEQVKKNVLPKIKKFNPGFLVLSAGFDTYYKDPLGAFALKTEDYAVLGELFGKLSLPTVILQEGGYCVDELGQNVAALLLGFKKGSKN